MKNIKWIGILTGITVLVLKAYPQAISQAEAEKVAVNFFVEKAQVNTDMIHFGMSYIIEEDQLPLYYVFNINEGFVIVASSKNVFPVLAWSAESAYMDKDFPPAFSRWMKSYQSHILKALHNNSQIPAFALKAWELYSDENFEPKVPLTGKDPFLLTTWSQGCFYNSQFPADTNGPCDHLWTGCVATAMAQVMKYYNFPKNGTGTHGYNSNYGWVEADFGNTQYGWVNMSYHLTGENDAVAQLLFHCAISVNSQFFPNGTGAFDFSARQALIQYFDYSPQTQFLWRDNFNNDDWLALLRAELNEDRPVIYGGADSESGSGHTLVCDGYQDTAFFHFNWGWNGTYNGYFYLDSLIAGDNYFDFQHDAVVGIKPDIDSIILAYPPANLVSSVSEHTVMLSWDAPELPGTNELLGYNIFRDGIAVNTEIIIQTGYSDYDVPPGDHEYFVKTVYIGAQSGPSEAVEAYVSQVKDLYVRNLVVYPVPARDFILIPAGQIQAESVRVKISDITGKVVHEGIIIPHPNDDLKIWLPEKLSGILFLQVNAGGIRYTAKMVVVKN